MKKIKKHLLNKLFFYPFFFIFFIYWIFNSTYSASVLNVAEDDYFIGDKNAPVTIIEYASLSCSHCANFHNNTLPTLIDEYVTTGKIRIIFRDFPFNYPALMGSMVLKCIDQDIRYQYTTALYQLQSMWVVQENKESKKELYKIMQSGGMTKDQFNACLANKDLENSILQGLMDAQDEFNINTTPSFLINGKLIEGNKSIKNFRKIIDKILNE